MPQNRLMCHNETNLCAGSAQTWRGTRGEIVNAQSALKPEETSWPAGNNLLTAKEAAAYLRVSINTLGRMEQLGLIVPYRTPGGHRRYSLAMLQNYLETTRVQH